MSGPFHLIGKTASLQISGRVSPEPLFYPMTGLLMRDLGEHGVASNHGAGYQGPNVLRMQAGHSVGRHFFAFVFSCLMRKIL